MSDIKRSRFLRDKVTRTFTTTRAMVLAYDKETRKLVYVDFEALGKKTAAEIASLFSQQNKNHMFCDIVSLDQIDELYYQDVDYFLEHAVKYEHQ